MSRIPILSPPFFSHIHYIKNHLSDEAMQYNTKGPYFDANHNNTHIVIELADYKIWLPYRID